MIFNKKYSKKLIIALRISLGLVFFWFGILKLFGYNPVYEIVYASFPWFSYGIGNLILGAGETLIGLGLLTNIFPKLTHTFLILHLAGTFTVFITGPELMFSPYFPILTLSGEFVFKNVVLAFAGLVVLSHGKK
ncbi:MAG: hypothetical protein G01um10142_349 [Parcubacteria group bacterium Gr01-1014_2]|nr:MAG: hypothetical protein G01um10142_349 [Parcubacteria group bacterium Gr01-1014_2]